MYQQSHNHSQALEIHLQIAVKHYPIALQIGLQHSATFSQHLHIALHTYSQHLPMTLHIFPRISQKHLQHDSTNLQYFSQQRLNLLQNHSQNFSKSSQYFSQKGASTYLKQTYTKIHGKQIIMNTNLHKFSNKSSLLSQIPQQQTFGSFTAFLSFFFFHEDDPPDRFDLYRFLFPDE